MDTHELYSRLNFEQLIDIFDQTPLALSIYDETGLQVAMNQANANLFNIQRDEMIGRFNMVTDPQLAASGSPERHARVMQGETVITPPHTFEARQSGYQDDSPAEERWFVGTYAPVRNKADKVTHLLAILRDVTHEVRQNESIAAAQAEIANQREEIAGQQAIIESLSTPVVQVWTGILAMPLVGAIDSRRATQVTEGLLMAVSDQQAECVIIDITGVPMVDTQVAQYLVQTAYACRLLGCEVALVGIGVEMAQTLVQLGVDLRALNTMANLQAGIAWAFSRLDMQVIERAGAPRSASLGKMLDM
jgi:rsbT co-antagonist protein RsbR